MAVARAGPGLVGPLFWHEVARQTRRGHGTLLRCLFVLLLLGAAYYTYANRFGVDFRNITFAPTLVSSDPGVVRIMEERAAQEFFRLCMLCQAVALLLVTPSYVATSIAEEKQRGSIELLFTTFVTDREIVLGKLLSRLLHLAAFLLAGLPVVCLALFWGGLTVGGILIGYGILLVTLFSIGGISIFCSTVCRTVLGAELCSYGLYLLINGIILFFALGADHAEASSPIGLFYVWKSPENLSLQRTIYACMAVHAGLYGALGLAFLVLAVVLLRRRCLSETDRNRRQPGQTVAARYRRQREIPVTILAEPAGEDASVNGWGGGATAAPPPQRRGRKKPRGETVLVAEYVRNYEIVPLTEDALLWKEMHHGTTMAAPANLRLLRFILAGMAVIVVGISVLLLAAQDGSGRRSQEELAVTRAFLNDVLRFVAVLALAGWCAAAGLRAANTLSQERAQQTLLGLLTLPQERRDILRAKWVGSLLRYQWLGWVALAACVAGLFTGMIHPLALPLLALAFACHLSFLASFGLWLSLMVRSPLSVQLCMSLVIFMMCAAPLLIALYAPDEAAEITRNTFWHRFEDVGVSPINSWWYLMSGWPVFNRKLVVTVAGIVLGLLIYAGVGWALWKGAGLLFNRIQGDEVAGRT